MAAYRLNQKISGKVPNIGGSGKETTGFEFTIISYQIEVLYLRVEYMKKLFITRHRKPTKISSLLNFTSFSSLTSERINKLLQH